MHHGRPPEEGRPGSAWRILPFTLLLPLALVFFTEFNGPDIHSALRNALGMFGSRLPGAGTWFSVLLLNAAIFLYLGPVFRLKRARACSDQGRIDRCTAALKRFDHLDGFLIFASVAAFLLGSLFAARESEAAHFFMAPKAYSFMEALATGFLVGVSLSVNLGNLLFHARRHALLLAPGSDLKRSSLYKKIFLIITALVFFTVFQVFASSGAFFRLGALIPGQPGRQGLPDPTLALGTRSASLRGVLSVFYLRMGLLFVFVAQLFWQIKWMVTRPLETIMGRLAALDAGAKKREIEIVQNDEFSRVYAVINKLIRKQEAELATSLGRLDSITANAADPILVCDSACRILEFNPAAERYFGVGAGEAEGRFVQELMELPGIPRGTCPDAETLFQSPAAREASSAIPPSRATAASSASRPTPRGPRVPRAGSTRSYSATSSTR